MKRVKILVLSSIFAVIVSLFGTGFSFQASAAEPTKQIGFKENIKGTYFVIPYDKETVRMEKSVSSDNRVGEINVYDKNTNELLDTYKVEDIVPSTKTMAAMATTGTVIREASQTKKAGSASAKLTTRMSVYTSGSFVQIQSVLSNNWSTVSGVHQLVNSNADTISSTGSFPTTQIQTVGATTFEVKTTVSGQAGWEAAGFSISASYGSEIYMRKNVSFNFTYSVY
ncbi:hypothetical protein [Neobacillus sp. OS1-33]|jgi:hypothetical protein|uniref:hypothetical protein n=1 Tax=Neobacillus sp. OS1-33 TaxID=3070683 RepID=UPI0027DEB253|nr:hypothetical protein [Neobacillus sp. OS1-33]WML27382.1 hypothetical protein RCG22_07140 [Neobacillus sp. OS1-33]